MDIRYQIRDLIRKHTSLSRGTMSFGDSLILIAGLILIRRIECIIAPYRKQMRNQYVHSVNILDDEALDRTLLQEGAVKFYNKTNFTLEGIFMSDSKVVNNLVIYIEGFNPQVRHIFELLNFEMIIADSNYNNLLMSALNAVIALELDPKEVNGTMIVSEVINPFYQFQSRTSGMSTSPMLYAELVRRLLPKKSRGEFTDIYDPTCGLNRLTRSLESALDPTSKLHEEGLIRSYGQDVHQLSCAISQICKLIIGENPDDIRCGDTLTQDLFPGRKFQYIVADLPMGLKGYDSLSSFSDPRFSAGITKNDASLMFIQHIVSKMDPHGCRAAVFTSHAPLVNGGAGSNENNVRRWLIEQDLIETIIALPKRANPRVDVPVYLWILDNNKESEQKGKIRVIDASKLMDAEDRITHMPSYLLAHRIKVKLYKQDVPGTSALIDSKSFGNYQVCLINQTTKEKRLVEVPILEDVEISLENRGYKISKFSLSSEVRDNQDSFGEKDLWEIDYYGSNSVYKFDLLKLLATDNNAQSSVRTNFEVLKPSLTDSVMFLNTLKDMTVPHTVRVPIKETGEWFKTIPNHWQMTLARYFFEVRRSKSNLSIKEKDEELSTEWIPVLSVSYLRGEKNNAQVANANEAYSTGQIVNHGDIVMIISGSKAGEVLEGKTGVLGGTLAHIIPSNSILPRFLWYLLKAAETYLQSSLPEYGIPHLKIKTIEDMMICVPPLEEQEIIAKYLDNYCGVIEDLSKLGFNNPQLKEFQKSLIYEAVTGKLDLDDMK